MTSTKPETSSLTFGKILALGLAVFTVLVAVFWVGFLASDDSTYARGALGWLTEFPYVGGHGTIRYTITIPVALSFLAFGQNEVALVLPSFLYALGLLSLVALAAYRIGGVLAAAFTLLFAVTMPLMVTQGSIATIDLVEGFFIFASLTCLMKASEAEAKVKWLLAAGALAALGFLSRETTVFLIAYYGILFLAGALVARKYYWVMAASFLLVWGLEILYLWIMTGDPLYRVTIAANHDSTIDRSIDLAGNVIVHPVIDPLLTILLNNEFTLLFWIAIPAAVWGLRRSSFGSQERQAIRIWTGLAVVWLVLAGAAVTLLPLNPRYFMITALAVIIPLGSTFALLWRHGESAQKLVAGATGLVLLANMAALYLENRHVQFGVLQYAAWVDEYDEPIYGDPETIRRADILLRWNKADGHVFGEFPVSDGEAKLLFIDPHRLGPDWRTKMEGFKQVAEAAPTPKLLYHVLEAIGVMDVMPIKLKKNLLGGYDPVYLFRHPEAPALSEETLAAPQGE